MRTDQLIEQLTQEAKPVRRLPPVGKRLTYWFTVAILCLSVGVLVLGIRADIYRQISNPVFIIEAFLILLISLLSAWSAFNMSIPGNEIPKWERMFPYLSFALWIVLLLFHIGKIFLTHGMRVDIFTRGWACISDLLLLGTLPCLILLVMIRQAAPVELGIVGLMMVLAAASLAVLGTHLTCMSHDAAHLLVWHLVPVTFLTGLGILLGRKLFRW